MTRIQDATEKIVKIIYSCENHLQLETIPTILLNFNTVYKDDVAFEVCWNIINNAHKDKSSQLTRDTEISNKITKAKFKADLQKLADNIIEDFDFGRVHNVMNAMDWHWAIPSGTEVSFDDALFEVPTIETLIVAAHNRFNDVIEMAIKEPNERSESSSGGLRAEYFPLGEDNKPSLRLSFVVDEWDDTLE